MTSRRNFQIQDGLSTPSRQSPSHGIRHSRFPALVSGFPEAGKKHAQLAAEKAQLQAALAREHELKREWSRFSPPGHFYSPLPSREEIADAFARGGFGPPFSAIDLNEAGQFARLERFAAFYPEQPFPEQPTAGWRF